jgi:hypothetical protein
MPCGSHGSIFSVFSGDPPAASRWTGRFPRRPPGPTSSSILYLLICLKHPRGLSRRGADGVGRLGGEFKVFDAVAVHRGAGPGRASSGGSAPRRRDGITCSRFRNKREKGLTAPGRDKRPFLLFAAVRWIIRNRSTGTTVLRTAGPVMDCAGVAPRLRWKSFALRWRVS